MTRGWSPTRSLVSARAGHRGAHRAQPRGDDADAGGGGGGGGGAKHEHGEAEGAALPGHALSPALSVRA